MKVLITSLMVFCAIVVFGQNETVKKVGKKSSVQLNAITLSEEKVSTEIHGLVIVDDNSPCKVMIKVFINNETVRFYPLNLSEEFQQNGLDIYFKYTLSKDPMIQACGIVKPVNVIGARLARP